MASALHTTCNPGKLISKCRLLAQQPFGLVCVPARGMKLKEYKDVAKDIRGVPYDKAPWPYEDKQYRWYHSFFNIDKTVHRLDENSKVIVVEGNIGVGKTTMAKKLAELLGMKYLPEPGFPDYYQMIIGLDLRDYKDRLGPTTQHFEVEEFYRNPHHMLVARFQVTKYLARYYQYCNALLHLFSTGQGIVMERSAYSDFIFVEAMVAKGFMGRQARQLYYELKSNTIQDLLRPHCIIYLDATVDTCLERIKKRGLEHEVNSEVLTPEYLQMIESGYKDKLLKQSEPFTEIVVYDWTKPADAEVVAEDLEKVPFEKHRYYFEPMFRDWRETYQDSDWDELRLKYALWKTWAPVHSAVVEAYGAEELWATSADNAKLNAIRDEIEEEGSPYYTKPGSSFMSHLRTAFLPRKDAASDARVLERKAAERAEPPFRISS